MPLKWLIAVIASLAIVGTAEARQGPGFDCAKAHHPLARLICGDDDLSQIDLNLNQAYDAYRGTLGAEAKKNLDKEESAFIRAVIAVYRTYRDTEEISSRFGLCCRECHNATTGRLATSGKCSFSGSPSHSARA
jgi:uncharacterized protein YecT (DUF1311 family)